MAKRGKAAAALAALAVVLLVLAVLQNAYFALAGAYLLVVAPLIGLVVAIDVFRALREVCTTGSRSAATHAMAGVVFLVVGGLYACPSAGSCCSCPRCCSRSPRRSRPAPPDSGRRAPGRR